VELLQTRLWGEHGHLVACAQARHHL
jgi:hypothetical protein